MLAVNEIHIFIQNCFMVSKPLTHITDIRGGLILQHICPYKHLPSCSNKTRLRQLSPLEISFFTYPAWTQSHGPHRWLFCLPSTVST